MAEEKKAVGVVDVEIGDAANHSEEACAPSEFSQPVFERESGRGYKKYHP